MQMLTPAFYLCTICLNLTSKGENSQTCKCEPEKSIEGIDCPSGFHLCYVCSLNLAGGTSRYSWEACEICLAANTHIKATTGNALNLGRHSLMNGLSLKINADKDQIKKMAEELLFFHQDMMQLETFANIRTRQLIDSNPKWRVLNKIPLIIWTSRQKRDAQTEINISLQRIKTLINILNSRKSPENI